MKRFVLLILISVLFVPSEYLVAQTRNWNTPPYAEDYAFITNDGAWCWFSDPRAIYVDNKMFGGFVDKEGSIWAFSYDPQTQDKYQYKLSDKFDYDDHANPSIMALPDKRLVLYFSAHGGTKNSPIYYAITKNPKDIRSWGELQSIDPEMPGNLGVCYTNAAMLSEENNRTYLFFRGRNFKPTFVFTDDFKKWSDPVTIVVNDTIYGESGRPYMKVTTNHKDKIFFAFTDAHPRDRATNSIYFMMYRDGKLCKANSEVISDSFNKPVMPSQTDKVYDATKTFDKAWIWDIAFDKEENPVLVYARFSHARSIHSYWYARWNGQEWENYKITDAAQCFMRNDYNNKNYLETEENYSGGVYLDHENPSIVYTSRPINNVFEIEKWTFTGEKEPWKSEAVTKDSERDNIRPFVVRNHSGNQPDVLWAYNYKYPGFRAYDSGIRINQKDKGFDSRLNREAIKTVAAKVADWQLRDYETAPFNSSVARGWRNGVLYNGMFDWAELSGNNKYFKYLEHIFDKEAWQVGNRMYNADDICVAQGYLDMYTRYKKDHMLIPTLARAEWLIDHRPEGNIDITKGHSDRWWWCDALYMAPAVYSRLYTITGNKEFMKFADREFKATYDHLYDKDEKLFYRDAKYFGKKEANGKKIFWGRGNGWVMGGLAEILKTLPEKDTKYRPYYLQLFQEMSHRVAELQSEDGFWHASMLDPVTYSDPETSSTGLFVYALAYGINQGYLSKEEYLPVVTKGWEALVASVDTEGKVGWVQPVGQDPKRIEKRMTQVYGTGGFLMAACEVYKLAAESAVSLRDLVLRISPEKWNRPSPQGVFSDEMRYMLRQNNKYTLNKWFYEIKRFQDQTEEYYDFGGNTEHFIRPASHHAFTLALCLKLQVYDPEVTHVPEEKALDMLIGLIRSIAYRHKTNSGEKGWGDQWQSALWASQVAEAAWFVWDELSVCDQEMVCRMLVHEADRFLDYKVPYYQDAEGNILSKGDTKAEENAWNSNILTIATAMMPKYKQYDRWMQKNIELQISAYAMPEDISKTTIIDGAQLNKVLKGSNMNPDGTVINHNILHPDYMTAFMLNATNVWIYELAGKKGLQSSLYNGDIVYYALTERIFNGKTMYQKTVDGKASSLIYFPEGNDWGGKRQANYWLMDVMADQFGWDRNSTVKAMDWAVARNKEMISMIDRDTTGQYYQDIKEDKFPSREEWFGSHIAWGYLGWWLHN